MKVGLKTKPKKKNLANTFTQFSWQFLVLIQYFNNSLCILSASHNQTTFLSTGATKERSNNY